MVKMITSSEDELWNVIRMLASLLRMMEFIALGFDLVKLDLYGNISSKPDEGPGSSLNGMWISL